MKEQSDILIGMTTINLKQTSQLEQSENDDVFHDFYLCHTLCHWLDMQ